MEGGRLSPPPPLSVISLAGFGLTGSLSRSRPRVRHSPPARHRCLLFVSRLPRVRHSAPRRSPLSPGCCSLHQLESLASRLPLSRVCCAGRYFASRLRARLPAGCCCFHSPTPAATCISAGRVRGWGSYSRMLRLRRRLPALGRGFVRRASGALARVWCAGRARLRSHSASVVKERRPINGTIVSGGKQSALNPRRAANPAETRGFRKYPQIVVFTA